MRSIEGHVDHVAPGAQVAIGYNINQIQIIYGKTKNQDDARTMEPLIRRNVTMGFQRRLEESWQLRRTVILLDSWESALSAQDTLTEAGAWICDNVLQFIVDKAPRQLPRLYRLWPQPATGSVGPRCPTRGARTIAPGGSG